MSCRSLAALLLGLWFVLGWAARAETPGDAYLLEDPRLEPISIEALLAQPPRFRFPPGERVVWQVRYLGIPVGRVTKRVARFVELDGQRLAHVVATARTNEVFSLLYKLDDRAEAWIDVDTLRTVQTATLTRHRSAREVYEEVAFDWESRLVHVLEDKRSKRVRELSLGLGDHLHDTFDLVYAIRALSLEDGQHAAFPVYASGKIYGLELRARRTTPVVHPVLGTVEAVELRPRNLLDGEPQSDGRGRIVMSAEGRHVPLSLRGWMRAYTGIRIGGITGDLLAYEPGDPAWEALPLRAEAPRSGLPQTENGRLIARPTRELRAARERTGVARVDRKHWSISLESLVTCDPPASVSRFARTPGQRGVEAPPCRAPVMADRPGPALAEGRVDGLAEGQPGGFGS